ncbi:MAG: glycan-binding surface protein [Prevotella sp.]|jgi:hypothetical protein
MKTIIDIYKKSLYVAVLALLSVIMAACNDDDHASPVITQIRNYAAAPNDTIVSSVNPGQWIVLQGGNLGTVTGITFCSVPADIKSGLFADDNLVVQVPEIAYDQIMPGDLNVIRAFNGDGATEFQIDIIGAPLITHIRSMESAPNDTVLGSLIPGQQVNIIGYNLKNPQSIAFMGIDADLSTAQYTDSSVIVTVPKNLAGGDPTMMNTVSYTTEVGTGNYAIKIYGPPVVLSVSYEFPHEGDIVYLYGSNLTKIRRITFAGAEVKQIEEQPGGMSVKIVAPALDGSGPLEVEALGGKFTSAFNVNDLKTGILSDFEWEGSFQWEWWGGANLGTGETGIDWPPYCPEYVGATGMFLFTEFGKQDSGAGDNASTAIRIPEMQWVPENNMSDPVSSWVLKFEINVSKDWNGSTLCIQSGEAGYMFRYEPWQVTPTKTKDYKTDGWQTVTIPLSEFRAKDVTSGEGKGAPVETLAALLGPAGKSALFLYTHNYGTAQSKTGFYAAFDNFRVVKR